MGSVTIFLGGSGKYIASEMKLAREVWDTSDDSQQWLVLDFDPKPEAEHSGKASLAGLTHLPGSSFYDKVAGPNGSIQQEWATLDLAGGWIPSDDSSAPAGVQIPLASTIRRRIGRQAGTNRPVGQGGLWGLRASGLAAIEAALFGDYGQGDGRRYRDRFIQDLDRAIDQAGANGVPRILLVTSVAGGTGAGLFLPLALWLKARDKTGRCDIHVVGVLPSVFDHVYPLADNQRENQLELSTKGRSGAFAILRELSYLQHVEGQGRSPLRFLLPRGIRYRPGTSPISTVFWIGARNVQGRHAAKSEAYRELVTCMQVLTNDRVWNDVIQAGSARHFQERVLSAIVAGYPKPRVVAHLTSRVVSEVFAAALLATEGLRNLTRRASTPLPTGIGGAFANPALSDYGGTSTVGAEFLRAEHDDLVTGDPRTPVASRRLRSASVSRLLEGIDDARDLTTGLGQVTSIAEELNRDWLELLPGRGVDDDDWKAEVQARVDRLDEHFESARRNATDKVHQWMNQEVAEFESWLIGQLNLAFDAPAQPNDVVARWLGGLESQRSYLRQWFAASQEEELSWQVTGIADVPFDGDGAYEFGSDSRDAGAQSDMSLESRLPLGSYRYQPPKAGAFAVATRAVQDELERRPRPPKSGKLLAVLLGIVVGLGVGLGVAWFANGRSLPSSVEWPWLLVVISAAAIGGAVAYIVWSRFARSADEHARHLRYLDGLLEQLARERFLAVAWGAVRQEYAVTFANRVESVIRSAAEDVTALREVFLHIAKEADLAAASVTRAAHETAAVEPPPGVVPASAVGLLLSRIAIHSEGGSWEVVLERDGQQPPLRLPLADALEVLNAATQPEGESLRPQTTAERRYLEFVDGINDEALTCLTGGDEAFPQTLAEAVEQWPDVPLAELRRTLTDRTDRRTDPSSPANQGESAAPPAIVAYGGNSPGLPELARTVAEGLGLPGVSARQVADIGESVAVIRTFEPEGGVPGDLMELRASEQGVRATADRAYYYDYPFGDPETLGKEGEIRRRWSQLESDFHVLPELAAAAAIEAKLDRKRPLSNAIVRRLFGSDIGNDVHHPTLLGLFYFLRAAGSLTERKGETRSGALAREFVLNHAGGELLLLKTDENPSTDAPFGGGQPWVDCLERLELLMTLTGGSTSAMDAALPLAHSEQDSAETWRAWDQLQVNDLRALQTSIVRAWNATREAHSKRMQEVAREDGAAMQGSTAGGDWTNVVGAVLNYHEAHR